MRSYGIAKLAQLMFAVELDRRSRDAGWGVMSNAAHPGLSKTNLLSGASYAAGRPTLQARLTRLTWRLLPFIWLDVDEGIKPTLYAAVSPDAKGGDYYGPRGFYETVGGGVTFAHTPRLVRSEVDNDRLWRLSEELTGLSPIRSEVAMAFVGRTDVKDPGARRHQWDRLALRRERLYVEDAQFRDTRPDRGGRRGGAQARFAHRRGHGNRDGGLRRPAGARPAGPRGGDRPGDRALDAAASCRGSTPSPMANCGGGPARSPPIGTSTASIRCMPVTSSACWVSPASTTRHIELACIHLGAVVVPLQTSAPATQHAPILAETQTPDSRRRHRLSAGCGRGRAGRRAPRRLIVFDYEPRDDDQRATYDAACARLADAGSHCRSRRSTRSSSVAVGNSARPPCRRRR